MTSDLTSGPATHPYPSAVYDHSMYASHALAMAPTEPYHPGSYATAEVRIFMNKTCDSTLTFIILPSSRCAAQPPPLHPPTTLFFPLRRPVLQSALHLRNTPHRPHASLRSVTSLPTPRKRPPDLTRIHAHVSLALAPRADGGPRAAESDRGFCVFGVQGPEWFRWEFVHVV